MLISGAQNRTEVVVVVQDFYLLDITPCSVVICIAVELVVSYRKYLKLQIPQS